MKVRAVEWLSLRDQYAQRTAVVGRANAGDSSTEETWSSSTFNETPRDSLSASSSYTVSEPSSESVSSTSHRSLYTSATASRKTAKNPSPIGEDRSQPDANVPSRRRLVRALKCIICPHRNEKRISKQEQDKYRRRVVVNGEPILDVLVKSAEDFAGPINPGNYWYDNRAGFWGVESGPCFGIIPSFIEEFDSPMSRSCSGGTTNVLVNGRELHQTDLERLSNRGLSKTPGVAYRISIDGRVVDDASGKYCTGLGHLAPSVEKTRRGGGLYVPCSAVG